MSWKMLTLIFLHFSESFGLHLNMKAEIVIFLRSLILIFAHQKGGGFQTLSDMAGL